MSTCIVFRKANDNEVRIYDADGDHVGDVIRQRDILCPSSSHFIIHMNEEHVAARDMLRRSRIICVAIGAT